MAHEEPGRGLRPIQLRAQDRAEVADRDLHGIGRGALGLAADVVGGPRQHDGRGRVDARRRQDDAKVTEPGRAAGEEYDIANAGECGGAHDERCSEAQLLGENSHGDGRDERDAVGRDGQELGLRSCVA